MKEIEIKATNSKQKFVCTSKDKIMYNGCCYHLVTQTFSKGLDNVLPVISKIEFARLSKLGVLSKPYIVKRLVETTMYDFVFNK